ncbi:Endolytic peptidoglycan transglycosylase RlpA [Carnimonas sp. R-84981]
MRGRASFYADWFEGRTTANGETFSNNDMTAAHRSLPFGTKVQVTNLRNGRNAIVTINDRGPYVGNRLIDLTHKAASRLGMVEHGVQQVRLKVLD